jgi:hypothetical protein
MPDPMFPLGLRVVGPKNSSRRVIEHGRAFLAHSAVDPAAECGRESYLTSFQFDASLAAYFGGNGYSERGYDGPCFADWMWFDLDNADPQMALTHARQLVATVLERYRKLDEDDLLLFLSGSKGFHVGIPTALWRATPGQGFNKVCKGLAEYLAALAGVGIDAGTYDLKQLFRAPNSRHPKTGLHKRYLRYEELMGLSLDSIRELASVPMPFDVPDPPATADPAALNDWQKAMQALADQSKPKGPAGATGNGTGRLNRQTIELIREGTTEGNRHRLLFSAAANLAELGDIDRIAFELLTDVGLDMGLCPSDVRRQIATGLEHGRKQIKDNTDG